MAAPFPGTGNDPYRTILEHTSDIVVRYDADGRVVYASPAVQRVLGYSPEEVIGLDPRALLAPEFLERYDAALQQFTETRAPWTMRSRVRRKDGSYVWLEGRGIAVTDPATGQLLGRVGVLRDVSADVKAHEREQDALRRLENLNQLKNEFIGVVAHDMRDPLAAVQATADLLTHDWGNLSEDRKLDMINDIVGTTEQMASLIHDVLTMARLESGDVAFEARPIELRDIIERTVEQVQRAHPVRRCDVVLPADLPKALSDEDCLWRVLANLLTNAFKFSDPTSPVCVRAEPADKVIVVSVRDEGSGITADDLERVFEPFARLPGAEERHIAGVGLGLHICKSLVERQGGRIWGESLAGYGTTIFFTVPMADQPVAAERRSG